MKSSIVQPAWVEYMQFAYYVKADNEIQTCIDDVHKGLIKVRILYRPSPRPAGDCQSMMKKLIDIYGSWDYKG